MDTNQDSKFDELMSRYQAGEDPRELINDFKNITQTSPNNSVGWTCLAWLQLLCNYNFDALKSARIAVRLNSQDPQSRINLCLALLETKSKGVRDHIEYVKRTILVLPELEKEIKTSIEDGLGRRPDWKSLIKVKTWLGI